MRVQSRLTPAGQPGPSSPAGVPAGPQQLLADDALPALSDSLPGWQRPVLSCTSPGPSPDYITQQRRQHPAGPCYMTAALLNVPDFWLGWAADAAGAMLHVVSHPWVLQLCLLFFYVNGKLASERQDKEKTHWRILELEAEKKMERDDHWRNPAQLVRMAAQLNRDSRFYKEQLDDMIKAKQAAPSRRWTSLGLFPLRGLVGDDDDDWHLFSRCQSCRVC
ncbi:hypothetical protein COO60DRAFT_1702912 [Scenedesmus sp. NREL 46B-D3]|nr:hypothetical protein COO60DRAFT_1702912 [Scenedesmus sp. NREL 46B-D3]